MKNFTIPKPCHEDWQNMSPIEKGKHCESCKTTVYDFTKSSSKEVRRIYNLENGKLCGRFEMTPEITNSKFQKGVFYLERFTQKYFSRFGGVISVLSFLMIITGCEKKAFIGEVVVKQPDRGELNPLDSSDYFPMGKIQTQRSDSAVFNNKDVERKHRLGNLIDSVPDPMRSESKRKISSKKTKIKEDQPTVFVIGEIVFVDQDSIDQREEKK